MEKYLTFQQPTSVDGRYFWAGSQWTEFIDVYDPVTGKTTYTVTVDGQEYAGITSIQAFVMNKALPSDVTEGMEGFAERIMPHPDHGDYYDAVLRALDIDMRLNHEAQYSGKDPKLAIEELKNPGQHLRKDGVQSKNE